MAEIDKNATADALRKLGYEVPWEDKNMFTNPEAVEAPLGSVESAKSATPVPMPTARETPAPGPVESVEEPVGYSEPAPEPKPEPVYEEPQQIVSSNQSVEPAVTREPPKEQPAPEPAGPPAPVASPAAPAVTVTVAQPTARAPNQKRPEPAREPAPKPSTPAPSPTSPEDQRLLDASKSAPGPSNDGVEDVAFNPSDSSKRLQSIAGATQGRGQELLEGKGQILDSFSQTAAEIGQGRANLAIDRYVGQRDRADTAKARSEQSREDMVNEMTALKEKMGKPPTDTVGIVMGLVSALAASQGKMGLATAFQTLGGKMNDRMKRYQGELDAGEKSIEGLGKIASYDRLVATDEAGREELIEKGLAAELDAAFDQAKLQAKTADERNAVDQLKNHNLGVMSNQILARRQKAAAAAHENEAYRRIQGAKTQEEADAIRRKYGKVGERVSRDISATDAKFAETGGKILTNELTGARIGTELAKGANEAAKGQGGGVGTGVVQGWTATKELPNTVEAKVADRQMALANVQSRLDRLGQIAQDVKDNKVSKLDTTVIKEVGDIRNELVSLRTQLAGAGAPTGKEYDQTLDTIADPQEFFKLGDPKARIVATMRNAREGHERALRAVGYVPDDEFTALKKSGGGGSRPAAGGTVEVRDPGTGKVMSVEPALAQALIKSSGFKMADEPEEE